MAHTEVWNGANEISPADGDQASAGASKIRALKVNIRERVAVDHYMDIAGTDADHGEHTKITLHAPISTPSNAANKAHLYSKDADLMGAGDKVELFWQDEDGNEVQLTNVGHAYVPVIQDKDKDTKIQMEEGADEDIIRFDIGGTEILIVDSEGIKPVSGYGISDLDGDTKIQLEEGADDDHIRMDVAGDEAFVLDADGILTLAKQVAFRAYPSASQSVNDGSQIVMEFDSETFDINGDYNITTDEFVAPVAGLYQFNAGIRLDSISVPTIQLSFYLNGARYSTAINRHGGTSVDFGCNHSDLIQLAIDDIVEVKVRHSNYFSHARDTIADYCYFSGIKVA